MSDMKKIHNIIMRRVYYAYAIRLAFHPRTVHVVAALALWAVFTSFVSIGDVLYNLSFVRVYNVDAFLLDAVKNTEAWTLLALGGFVALTISFLKSQVTFKSHRHQQPHQLNFS